MIEDKQLKIEPANLNDLSNILNLQKIAYQSEAKLINDFTILPLKQTLADLLIEFEQQLFLKAIHQNVLVGSVRCYQQGPTTHIGKLIVDPKFQNKGIGARLLEAAENVYPNSSRFELFTGEKSTKNLYFYQKYGYRLFKKRILSDKLTLVFLEKNNLNLP